MGNSIINRVRHSVEERDKVIVELYNSKEINNAVIGTLVKMGCSPDLAQDCKTDAIVAFIKSCYKENFEIKSSVKNYLIGAAKNIWLKGVTKGKKEYTTEDIQSSEVDPSIEEVLISKEKSDLLKMITGKLDDICQKVLALWAANARMKKIATEMSYKSEGMARKKKHQCLQRLYKIIADHPHVKEELRSIL